jgi:hypothetical protein
MNPTPTSIAEWRDVTPERFQREILPSGQPALLRGGIAAWPAVRAGRESPQALAQYLKGCDSGVNAHVMTADAAIGGRFFYDDALTARNFENRMMPFATALARLIELIDDPAPPAFYVGALPIPAGLQNFARDNRLDLVDPAVVPRIWLGNRVTVQTHYDLSFNIACVVAGRRRFTLFPPEQFENLYVGPLEFTLAGQPISMVRLESPDFGKYPRFRAALETAQVAELEPGDALFIPYMWWHHVVSLDAFNVLVNYWWDDMPAWQGSPFEALLHAIMSVRNLPPERRDLWRKLFEHYVFSGGQEALAHLDERQRGVQGKPSPKIAQLMRSYLAQNLAGRR